jgi:hypothetical protein
VKMAQLVNEEFELKNEDEFKNKNDANNNA